MGAMDSEGMGHRSACVSEMRGEDGCAWYTPMPGVQGKEPLTGDAPLMLSVRSSLRDQSEVGLKIST